MDFQASVEYLYSLGNEVSAMKLGLENIRKLLAGLGNPQTKYLKVQIAGTNGKGSVCSFLDSICNRAGIQTGLFTSPHLVSITERIRIDGMEIPEKEFARLATRVRDASQSLAEAGELETVPTFFEQVAAIALTAFAEAKIELAILETGLGGRLDATTAAKAEIVGITKIDFDHQKYLGDTIEAIAAEKAAIVNTGSRVVIGEQNDAAMRVLADVAANFGVAPKLAKDVRTYIQPGVRGRSASVKERAQLSVDFNTDKYTYRRVRLGLLGRHQVENAKIAILLAELLQDHFPIDPSDIIEGLETVRNPGRIEFRGRYLFDGAHNVAGAKALANFVGEFVKTPITLVYGVMRDKEASEIAGLLGPIAEQIVLTEIDNSRSLRLSELETAFFEANTGNLYTAKSVEAALRLAEEITPAIGLILVTGSLYLIGEVKRILTEAEQ